jgi:Sugar (and other) transporter
MEVVQHYFLSAQAHSIDEMLWGRFLVGLGIGVNTVLVPLYISEVILHFLKIQDHNCFQLL